MALRELDVDITPVLTGAGIIGLAVGFGAQTLVKDIISGLFLIAEDQVRIGDAVEINGIGGTVEQINLRTVVLRDHRRRRPHHFERRNPDARQQEQGLLVLRHRHRRGV